MSVAETLGIDGYEGWAQYTVGDGGDLTVEFEKDVTRCCRCWEEVSEYADGWHSELDDSLECEGEPHEVAPAPFAWCNSAAIQPNAADDSITVSISVADPRGAFTMTVYRTDEGKLILAVPHPSRGFLHAPLTRLHEGTYAVGS